MSLVEREKGYAGCVQDGCPGYEGQFVRKKSKLMDCSPHSQKYDARFSAGTIHAGISWV
jgi:hypothetical protein